MDTLYGKPYKSKMSASINELGLDKTLDTYNDETRMVKELLLSDSKIDYMAGLSIMQGYFFDGGHTALNYESNLYGSDTVLGKAWADFMTDPENEQIVKRIFALNMNGDNIIYEFRLKPQRAEKYA